MVPFQDAKPASTPEVQEIKAGRDVAQTHAWVTFDPGGLRQRVTLLVGCLLQVSEDTPTLLTLRGNEKE